jgi:NDP-sugar pyrophosphorylase family protein
MPYGSVLFSAGRGKRLRPLTDVIPKPALPVLDVPLGASGLTHLLDAAPPVVVNASHLATSVASALKEFGEFKLFPEPPGGLGTAGTLKALEDELDSTFLTLNSDALFDLDLESLVRHHHQSNAVCTAAVIAVESGADLAGNGGRATAFVDRRIDSHASGFRFTGAAAYSRDVLKLIPEQTPAGLGETVFPLLVDRGELAIYEHAGYALDVGTPAAYLRANLDVLNGRVALPVRPPGQILDVDGGRAYVGPGAEVKETSLGPGAVILRDAKVADGATLENAIVMPGEELAPNERLQDMIAWAGRRLKVG